MNVQEFKNELVRLQKQDSYTNEDVMSVTRMATQIMESDRLSADRKRQFADHMSAVKQKGFQNLKSGDIKMIINLFIQGLS